MRWTLLLALAACGGPSEASRAPIRFLHTFGAEETELLNAVVAERGVAVESSLVPFARGQQVIAEILRQGRDCPDLIRIDATWLPSLVSADLLAPVPLDFVDPDWTPEAFALARGSVYFDPARDPATQTWMGLPQTVDGLVVLRDADARPAPASSSIADLVAAARVAKTEATRRPLGVRVDGYWFVPWLRAAGGDLAPNRLDNAASAVASFAELFGDVVAPPPPSGSEAPDELRRWNAHEIAYWVTGPWSLASLPDRDHIAVSALAHAPRGGQLLVVPRCARHPEDGWRLATELTSPAVEQRFADAFGTVPTRRSAMANVSPLVRDVYGALQSGEPLPQAKDTSLLFDDLNPALAAVVDGDATPSEAIAGVRRGWKRL